MFSKQLRLMRRLGALLLVATLVGGGTAASMTVAAQAAPSPAVQVLPVAEFNAPLCVGETDNKPKEATGPVADLTRIWGPRLADYNAGNAVVLYDVFGTNTNDGYPAVCGTRFVAGVGAVSEWMFCTDLFYHVCAGTDAAGNLVDVDGTVIPGMDHKTGNDKLGPDQEKLISYLIQNVHDFAGTGYYNFPATQATRTGTSYERASLQILVWCISDPVDLAVHGSDSEKDRQKTCADNMGPAEQARLLALIPDAPTVQLAFSTPTSTLHIGDTATFTLTTNLYNQPIDLSARGVTGSLKVISGDATLTGTTLTVAGTNPAVSTTITVGFTSTAAGTVTASASAQPVSRSQLVWNQSPGVALDKKPCQVFGTFNEVNQVPVGAQASATFASEESTSSASSTDTSTSTDTTTATDTSSATDTGSASGGATGTSSKSATATTDLAQTGASNSMLLAFGAVLIAGLGIVLVSTRRVGRKH